MTFRSGIIYIENAELIRYFHCRTVDYGHGIRHHILIYLPISGQLQGNTTESGHCMDI